MSQRHGRAGFWDTKATDPLKLKGSSKGEGWCPGRGKRGHRSILFSTRHPILQLSSSACLGAERPFVCSPQNWVKDTVGPGTTLITLTLSVQADNMATESSPLTTHVLDTASGLPAQGLCLRLSRLEAPCQQWMELRTR